jgi:ribosomal protein L37AE/L43A
VTEVEDIYTSATDKPVCPYCGEEQDDSDTEAFQPGCQPECEKCGRTFNVTEVDYYPAYYTGKVLDRECLWCGNLIPEPGVLKDHAWCSCGTKYIMADVEKIPIEEWKKMRLRAGYSVKRVGGGLLEITQPSGKDVIAKIRAKLEEGEHTCR